MKTQPTPPPEVLGSPSGSPSSGTPTTDSAFDNLLTRLQWMHQGKIKPDDFLMWVDVSRQRCREVERSKANALEILRRLVEAKDEKEAHGDTLVYRTLKEGLWGAARNAISPENA